MWEQALAAHEAGRIRATEVRASDYIGEAGDQTNFGSRVIPRMRAGKPVLLMGRTDQPHSWTYTGDAAAAPGRSGRRTRARGDGPGTYPATPARTQTEVIAGSGRRHGCANAEDPDGRGGHAAPVGLFNRPAAELVEMLYEFDRPFVLDSSR